MLAWPYEKRKWYVERLKVQQEKEQEALKSRSK